MYHHVDSDRCSNDLTMFEKHLIYIKENFTTVFPQEDISKNKNSVCLTFDDAYADFYYFIYPLLKKYNLKAILGVPTKYILDATKESKNTRLNFEHNHLFENYKKGTFCTYEEMQEMCKSGLVQIASHSHTHTNLLEDDINLESEFIESKNILEKKLNIKVDSFIFPFGKYDERIANECSKHYKYMFRIGNAIHKDFSGINGIIYRVDGDNLKTPNEIFKTSNILKYKFKAFTKKIVGKK